MKLSDKTLALYRQARAAATAAYDARALAYMHSQSAIICTATHSREARAEFAAQSKAKADQAQADADEAQALSAQLDKLTEKTRNPIARSDAEYARAAANAAQWNARNARESAILAAAAVR